MSNNQLLVYLAGDISKPGRWMMRKEYCWFCNKEIKNREKKQKWLGFHAEGEFVAHLKCFKKEMPKNLQ